MEMRSLRDRVEQIDRLEINDEASTETSLAVFEDGLGTSIDNHESLDYLINYGAEAWLSSRHNGCWTHFLP